MELKFILEVLLFSAQKALSPAELRETLTTAAQEEGEFAGAFNRTKEDEIVAALEELAADHEDAGRSYRLVCVAGAWQFVSKPEYAPWLRALVGHKTEATPTVTARARNARDHRLPPASDPVRDRTGPRSVRGWRDADVARTRPDRSHRPRGGRGPADELRDHPFIPRILRTAQPGGSPRRG